MYLGGKARETKNMSSHLLVHSSDTCAGQDWPWLKPGPGNRSRFPTWVAGTQALESPAPAFQGLHLQETGIRSKRQELNPGSYLWRYPGQCYCGIRSSLGDFFLKLFGIWDEGGELVNRTVGIDLFF